MLQEFLSLYLDCLRDFLRHLLRLVGLDVLDNVKFNGLLESFGHLLRQQSLPVVTVELIIEDEALTFEGLIVEEVLWVRVLGGVFVGQQLVQLLLIRLGELLSSNVL